MGLIFAVLLAFTQGRPHDVPSQRPMPSFDIGSFIVGGSQVDITDHPHQASLQFTSGSHTCAAIISSTRLACAAHCTQGYSYQIRVGSTHRSIGGTVVRIASICNHPGYNNGMVGTFSNDVSTLQPAEALVFNNETISAF